MIGYGNFKVKTERNIIDFDEESRELSIKYKDVEIAKIRLLKDLNKREIDAINVGVRCATNVIKNRGNWCVICGEDMGITNPRQLCRKTYCENQDNGENQDECDSGNESDNSLFLNVAKKPKKNEDWNAYPT